MSAKLIAGFPATGKSTAFDKYSESEYIFLDSDSSKFDKDFFPVNYIKHIKDNIDKADVIFVSSHDVVRNALVNNGLWYTLVYPNKYLKNEYIKRYKDRGNPQQFIDLVEKNWDMWISECELQKGCEHVVLESYEYISDIIKH